MHEADSRQRSPPQRFEKTQCSNNKSKEKTDTYWNRKVLEGNKAT